MTPYSTGVATKKKRGGGGANTDELDLLGEGEDGGGANEEEEENENDLEMDTMIKVRFSSLIFMPCPKWLIPLPLYTPSLSTHDVSTG